MSEHKALYLHIPFCHHICHYCDFAKTALFDETIVLRYLTQLNEYLRLSAKSGLLGPLESIFIGGGTPGMFGREYETLFQTLEPFMVNTCEVTIEANPKDICKTSLELWKGFGINRLSVGIQTFNESGLKFLTRQHSSAEGLAALNLAKEYIPNINIDLIYGWNNQTLADWQSDLDQFLQLELPHLSCYSLTYEPGTVFGRRVARGKLIPTEDERYDAMYEAAKLKLKEFDHEEISNWSKSGYSCKHNWAYWRGDHFLGFGVGAHGYLNTSPLGERYSFTKNMKIFMEQSPERFFDGQSPGLCVWLPSSKESWLIEKIGCGFRTCKGVDLNELQRVTEMKFIPNSNVTKALKRNLIELEGSMIKLNQTEWIRENSWCGELIECFHPESSQ